MANHTHTIRKFVKYLNNSDEQGGYWLPNIQRRFVWKEEQIERLYDSILREYPIGTLLVWKTKSNIKRRKFIKNYYTDIPLKTFYEVSNQCQKMLVLDGQQRLQLLFIGLIGSYSNKELHIEILSGENVTSEEIKYKFKFIESDNADFPNLNIKPIVMGNDRANTIVKQLKVKYGDKITNENEDKIKENLDLIREIFCTQENILFQLVDSTDKPDVYKEDDIVEIFIRANSGGTQLEKSDLLFSLLTVSWENAENEIDELLNDLNQTGYKFDRDFILKVCLILLGEGAKYEINKFRNPKLKAGIESEWNKISKAMRVIKDFIYGKTFLKTNKTFPSYLSLIPLIYAQYHFENDWKNKENDGFIYLTKVNLTRVFGGVSDSFTDGLISSIEKIRVFVKIKYLSL